MKDTICVTVYKYWTFWVTPAVREWLDIADEEEQIRVGDAMTGDDKANLRAYLKFAAKCREKLNDGMDGYQGYAILIPKK